MNAVLKPGWFFGCPFDYEKLGKKFLALLGNISVKNENVNWMKAQNLGEQINSGNIFA